MCDSQNDSRYSDLRAVPSSDSRAPPAPRVFLPDLGGTCDGVSMAVFFLCEPGTRYSRHKPVFVRLNSPLLHMQYGIY